MVSSLPQPMMAMGAYPDAHGAYAAHQLAHSWRAGLPLAYEEEFLGAAIGQKRHRVEESPSEFAYLPGASSTYSTSPSAKASPTPSWAPTGAGLDEIVKKATERSYQSSPSYTQQTHSSDSGKHSDVSKHYSPPRNEGKNSSAISWSSQSGLPIVDCKFSRSRE